MPPKRISKSAYNRLRGRVGGTTGPLSEQRPPSSTGGFSISLRPPVQRDVNEVTRARDTGHGVLGFPSTGQVGSFQRVFNPFVTPAAQRPSVYSGFNAVNDIGSVSRINLQPLFDSANESDTPIGQTTPRQPINQSAPPNSGLADLGQQSNDFTHRPDPTTPWVLDPTGDYIRSRTNPMSRTRAEERSGDSLSEFMDTYGAITQPTDLGGAAVSGAQDLFSSTQQTLANPRGQSWTDRSLSYLDRRIGDGYMSNDPALNRNVPDMTTPDTAPGNSIHPTTDQQIATPSYGSVPRHGGMDSSTQNNVAAIHATVQGPQGNDFGNIVIQNTPIMPQSNNDAAGVHTSMGGSSGASQQVDGSWTLDINPIQPATTLQTIPPAADIPVRTAGPAQLTVKTPSQAQYWSHHGKYGKKPIAVFA